MVALSIQLQIRDVVHALLDGGLGQSRFGGGGGQCSLKELKGWSAGRARFLELRRASDRALEELEVALLELKEALWRGDLGVHRAADIQAAMQQLEQAALHTLVREVAVNVTQE